MSENKKNHDGVLATLGKLENELDNIEDSRNYSDGFFNDQIKDFDIKDRVKVEQKKLKLKHKKNPRRLFSKRRIQVFMDAVIAILQQLTCKA